MDRSVELSRDHIIFWGMEGPGFNQGGAGKGSSSHRGGYGTFEPQGDYGTPLQTQETYGQGSDAFSFGYNFFADIGVPYRGVSADPQDTYSDAEQDDIEPGMAFSEAAAEGPSTAQRRVRRPGKEVAREEDPVLDSDSDSD